MTTQTFTTVALDVVGQYNQVGKQLVHAYRTGTARAVAGVNQRFADVVNARSLPLFNGAAKASLIDAQQRLTGFVANGVALGTTGADIAIDRLADGVKGGIERVSGTTAGIESALNTSVLGTVGTLALPVAHVSLEIANRLVQGSKRLTKRVAGDSDAVVAAPAKTAKKRVQRTARRA